jgi:hypothetical protein
MPTEQINLVVILTSVTVTSAAARSVCLAEYIVDPIYHVLDFRAFDRPAFAGYQVSFFAHFTLLSNDARWIRNRAYLSVRSPTCEAVRC